jgi:peptidoglycan/LPS O-acetylase OafA/YrhL
MTSNVSAEGRYAHIDALRAAAVMVVMAAHADISSLDASIGVTVFFTISGFVITSLVLKERMRLRAFRLGLFYLSRGIKLIPPLLLSLILPTFIWAIFHPVNWWAFASQVFFVFNWAQIKGPLITHQTLPGSGVVWSLGVEEQFYIVFALIWLVLARRKFAETALIVLCALSIAFSPVARYGCGSLEALRCVRATDTRLDSIAWGVLAAVLISIYQRGGFAWLGRLGRDWTVLAAVLLIACSKVRPDYLWFLDFTLQSIATAMAITYGLMPEPTSLRKFIYSVSSWKPISVIGLASYSIYLTHNPLIRLLESMHLQHTFTMVAGVVLGALVGVLMWRLVEVPALRWKKRLMKKF